MLINMVKIFIKVIYLNFEFSLNLDSHYEFKVINWTYRGDGYTFYSINMTSQQWLTGFTFYGNSILFLFINFYFKIANDSTSSIWYHSINVAVPDVIKVKDTMFLYIANGDNDPK